MTVLDSLPIGYRDFHRDANFNYQLNRFLFTLPVDRVAPLAARIHDFATWKSVLLEAGGAAESESRFAEAAWLVRAAEFFMIPGDPGKASAYDRFVALHRRTHSLDDAERTEVPYERGALPAIVLRRASPKSTVVVHAGFDAFIEEFLALGQFLRESGHEVVLFEGPGQGAALVKHRIPMTHEWERPVARVLDHVGARDVTLLGISLGGYLAPRAAAFEPRVRRVIAFDVMYDFFECVLSHAPAAARASIRALLRAPLGAAAIDAVARRQMRRDLTAAWGVEQGMHVTGASSPSEFFEKLSRYHLREVSSRIRQDVLVMAGSEDHHVPLEQLFDQARALGAARSVTTRLFTSAEQASSHCQYGNLPLAFRTMARWIDDRL